MACVHLCHKQNLSLKIQTYNTKIALHAAFKPLYLPLHETIFCLKFLAATSNLRVAQNLVHLGKFLHFSQKVVFCFVLRRQCRISQDNASQLTKFQAVSHSDSSFPPKTQMCRMTSSLDLGPTCMVLEVVFRLNFSSCGNRNGFSFDDVRQCLILNGW